MFHRLHKGHNKYMFRTPTKGLKSGFPLATMSMNANYFRRKQKEKIRPKKTAILFSCPCTDENCIDMM